MSMGIEGWLVDTKAGRRDNDWLDRGTGQSMT